MIEEEGGSLAHALHIYYPLCLSPGTSEKGTELRVYSHLLGVYFYSSIH